MNTESGSKLKDGTALTAGGTIQLGEDDPQEFTFDGSELTLVNGEKIKIKTTGSQTDVGTTENGYEIHWEDDATTANAANYTFVDGELGTLEVYANKVAYDGNAGDDATLDNMPEGSDEVGAEYEIPDNVPTREHYNFTGWNTDIHGDGDAYSPGDTYTFADDVHEVTFYAQWEVKMQKVTYDPDGGTFRESTDPTVEDHEYDYDIKVAEAATRDGYVFKGWQEVDGKLYQPDDDFHVTGDTTFVAQWEAVVGLTYDPQGGTYEGSTDPTTVQHEATAEVVIGDAPTWDKYHEFVEWNTAADGSGDAYQPGTSAVFKEDTTLYAVWKDVAYYILTFDPAGGEFRGSTSPTSIEYKGGTTTAIPEAPTREGYKFLYWKGSEYQPGDEYVVVEDHTFVAQWEKIEEPVPEPTPDSEPEAEPKDDPTPAPKKAAKSVAAPASKVANTGDSVNIALLAGFMLATLAVVVVSRRRANATSATTRAKHARK